MDVMQVVGKGILLECCINRSCDLVHCEKKGMFPRFQLGIKYSRGFFFKVFSFASLLLPYSIRYHVCHHSLVILYLLNAFDTNHCHYPRRYPHAAIKVQCYCPASDLACPGFRRIDASCQPYPPNCRPHESCPEQGEGCDFIVHWYVAFLLQNPDCCRVKLPSHLISFSSPNRRSHRLRQL